MFQLTKYLLLTCLVIIEISVNLYSQENEGVSVKERSQILGYWKMVDFPKKELNKTDPWPLPTQWFYFDESGKFYSMMLSDTQNRTADQIKSILNNFLSFPKNMIPNFVLEESNVTVDNPEDKTYREIWKVSIFEKDIENFAKKGDLLMALRRMNKKGERSEEIVYYRLLTRVN